MEETSPPAPGGDVRPQRGATRSYLLESGDGALASPSISPALAPVTYVIALEPLDPSDVRGTPVRSGKAVVNRSGAKKAHVYQCVGCHAHHFQPIARVVKGDKVVAGAGPPVGMTCAHCGRPMNVGGPLWTAPLQDVDFVDALSARLSSDEGADFASRRRLAGLLANVGEELPDVPLFTHLPNYPLPP